MIPIKKEGKMLLLPIFERLLLPTLGSQKEYEEPMIYLNFFVPDSPFHWYVAEGSPITNDFIFFGFHIGSDLEEDWKWKEFKLSDLRTFISGGGAGVVRDPKFKTGRFTDVVPHPHLNRDFSH
jgi:hypothetical protein